MLSNQILLNSKLPFVFLLLAGLVFFSASCADDIEEAIDEVTYDITVINKTTDDLDLYESVDGSAFEFLSTVKADSSTNVVGIVDTDVTIKAQKSDGTLVEERTFNQSDDMDQTWEIN